MSRDFRERLLEGAPKPGEIFAEKYRIENVLGVGGMGYVLGARHLQLDERVALKLLLDEGARRPETVARFLREGQAAVKIRSEHVGRVLDVASYDGIPFIVMEYLEGADLAALLEERGPLPDKLVVDYVLQACEALAEAHAQRIVHRDLKPANLFLTTRSDGRDCIKVLDFGISKILAPEGAEDAAMTRTSATMGTPLYMSPEQLMSSRNVDARTDLWSLGVILFELIAGRPPFVASSVAELGAKVLTSAPPDLRQLVPTTPAGLAEAVATCLRRDVRERFPTVAELADALAPYGTAAAKASANRIGHIMQGLERPHVLRRGEPTSNLRDSRDLSGPAIADTLRNTGTTPARRGTKVALGILALGAAIAVAATIRGARQRNLISSATNEPTSSELTSSAPSTRPVEISDGSPALLLASAASASATPTPSASSASPLTSHSAIRPGARLKQGGAHVIRPTVTAKGATVPTPSATSSSGFSSNRHE